MGEIAAPIHNADNNSTTYGRIAVDTTFIGRKYFGLYDIIWWEWYRLG